MYHILKWINEEKSACTHLKGLANKMAEELDQIRETTSPLITIGSNSSSMATAGTSLGHNTVSQISLYFIRTDNQGRVRRVQQVSVPEPGWFNFSVPGPGWFNFSVPGWFNFSVPWRVGLIFRTRALQ
jgi:hypothetical protein